MKEKLYQESELLHSILTDVWFTSSRGSPFIQNIHIWAGLGIMALVLSSVPFLRQKTIVYGILVVNVILIGAYGLFLYGEYKKLPEQISVCTSDIDCPNNSVCSFRDGWPRYFPFLTLHLCQSKYPVQGPICLDKNTLISIPNDQVPVQDLSSGDIVWSVDRQGRKVTATILQVNHTITPREHKLLRIELKDGRWLKASPGHPLPDGRAVKDLRIGAKLDDSSVVSITTIPYGNDETYDLLPASDTGYYFANGILVASTLK